MTRKQPKRLINLSTYQLINLFINDYWSYRGRKVISENNVYKWAGNIITELTALKKG